MSEKRIAAVIPTLGRSRHLAACLRALRAGAEPIEILVVDQAERPVALPEGLADRVLRPGRNLGFAAGTNLGIASTRSLYVATVNDDAIVEPEWAARLGAALDGDPELAAVQGANLRLDRPDLLDGCGIAWNRDLQAVQIGTGEPAPDPPGPGREIWGVSATAALYRRSALDRAALAPGRFFDPDLGSYYEDVDLAGRLRAMGFRAGWVPSARARHAGSTTAGAARWRLVYGNRHLALARLLGGGYWARLPRLLFRDLEDLARSLLAAEGARSVGIPAGWMRAAIRLPRFARRGRALAAIEPDG
ncbi:MAG TPA: glycosyltransferase family 2 protein [Thermoanaerobaculia bacterium]|nr:glycosyltransferase family 2 protein [Thermoanaerobaculia bacterium]